MVVAVLTVAAATVKRKFSHLCAASRICILISLEQVATVSSTRLESSLRLRLVNCANLMATVVTVAAVTVAAVAVTPAFVTAL